MMDEAALITGASRGIGKELARCLAADGHDCVLVARSEDDLRNVSDELENDYDITAVVQPMDLSVDDAAIKLFDILDEQGIFIHTLVNNAGFGNFGRFSNVSWGREEALLKLNMQTVTHLSKLFLNPMLEHDRGQILNVASTASFFPGPYMATYFGSKAYVLRFTEGLSYELKGTNVDITALCPGVTETGFEEQADTTGVEPFENVPFKADPKNVAKYGYRSLKTGKTIAVHGWFNWLMVFTRRFLPLFFIRMVAARFQGQPDGESE